MRKEQIIETLKTAINPDQLRKIFRDLAFVCHPDCGGTNEIMRVLLEQYERILRAFSGQTFHRRATNGEQTEYKYAYNETAENEFTTCLQAAISTLPSDCTIEVRGSWIWLFGNTRPHKERIKSLGFNWKPSDSEWYWRSSDQRKKFHGYHAKTRDEIRARYGAESHAGRQQGVR